MQVIHTRDCLTAWGTSIYSIGSRSQVYGLFLEEFPVSHGDTVDDKHYFSSPDGRSVEEDHPNFRGLATSMRFRS